MPIPAEVVQIGEKLGLKGVSRVRCRVVGGDQREKFVTRNVVGPIRVGDVIMLKDTVMDTESRFAER